MKGLPERLQGVAACPASTHHSTAASPIGGSDCPLLPSPLAAAFPSLGVPAPQAPEQQNGIKPGAPTVAAVVAASVQKRPVGPAAAAAATPAARPSLDGGSGEESRLAAESSLDSLAAQLRAMGLQDTPATLTPAQSLQVLQQCAARSIPQPADTQWQSVPQRPRPPPVPIAASYPMQACFQGGGVVASPCQCSASPALWLPGRLSVLLLVG